MGLCEVPLSMSVLGFGMGTIFTLFYCILDLSCDKCNVIYLYFLCCSVTGSVCLVCCVSDSDTIRNMFGYGCYYVVECYASVECGWRCSVG